MTIILPAQLKIRTVHRIRLASRILHGLCLAALAVFAWLLAGYWILPGLTGWAGLPDAGSDITVLAAGRTLAGLAHVPAILSVAASLLSAASLFGCFRDGEIFTAASVRHLGRFAWSALAATLLGILLPANALLLARLAGTELQAPLVLAVAGSDLATLFLCLTLVVLSWVLSEAKSVADDVRLIF